ncbi:MAG: 30S ribosomal protein S12 methylthiotransferase RimO [Erysipelotrichaceae bacterium]|nr:30S ribosomal protein S12 methylthiotransferase RimO [Erysipelotrichaceae bacterium]
MKIGIVSLGCSKNLMDTQLAMKFLRKQGHEFVDDPAKADAILINTCAFINDAKQESIDAILEMADYKQLKCKKLLVMGCLAQRYKEDLEAAIPEVDRFISLNEYPHLEEILKDELKGSEDREVDMVLATKPWTAYLRISDGCNNRCAFCAIPLIRGRYKSETMEDLLKQAEKLQKMGVRELNLIAQDSTKYGIDLYGKPMLKELLTKLNEMDFHWIRVLYMYPDEMDDELIETMVRLDKVLPYFDIPTQHGSDRLLRKMYRASNVAKLKSIVKKIRETCEDPTLRTTVIVGFPSERKEDFGLLMDYVREVRWDRLGAFKYSLEENTAAYDIHPRVSDRIAQSRLDRLMALQQQITIENNRRYLNTVQEVLVESVDYFGTTYTGRSRHYAPDDIDGHITFTSEEPLELGSFADVEITEINIYDWKGVHHKKPQQ